MATTAQIDANRRNAQASTGPKTAEGKAKSSRNAVSLGLFTKENCVQPHEQEEYDNLYSALWEDLSPIGAMEELYATEIVRGAWRLRRCATTEASLAKWVRNDSRHRHEMEHGKEVPCPPAHDPTCYEYSQSKQAAVDRARTQANGGIRRATADLRRLQNERLFRAARFPDDADASRFGLASFEEILPRLHDAANAQLLAAITPAVAPVEATEPVEGHAAASPVAEITKQTESAGGFRRHRKAEAAELLQSAA